MELNLTRIPDLVSDLADLVSDLREKGGVLIFPPGMYGGLYGQNLPYKFKKSYGDFQADLGSAAVCTNNNLLYSIVSNYTVHTELYPLPICIELLFLILFFFLFPLSTNFYQQFSNPECFCDAHTLKIKSATNFCCFGVVWFLLRGTFRT